MAVRVAKSVRALRLSCAAPAKKPYKRSDSGGLFIQVEPHGSKLWRLAYRFHGKQKTISGGIYPAVTLAAARKWRDAAKEQLARGEDPSMVRQEERRLARTAQATTFEAIAREWHTARSPRWADDYAKRIMIRLEQDIFPLLGGRAITEIDGPVLLDAIRKVERRGAIHAARRINNYCGEVFRYAIADGRCRRDPSHDIADALHEPRPVKHRGKIPPAEMPEFFKRLRADDSFPITHLALRWTILTMVRTGETRFARWSEFEHLDGAEPLWRIPAARMKMRSEHIVPLPRQALPLLEQIRSVAGDTPFLFPVERSRRSVISENRMLYFLYRLGYHGKATVHGFRGTASTALNESGLWESDWIERQLAHVEGNQIRAAYNSAAWLPQRRKMVQWWADRLEEWDHNG